MLFLFAVQLPITIAASYMISTTLLFIYGNKTSLSKIYLGATLIIVLMLLPSVLTMNHGVTPLFYLFASMILSYHAFQLSKAPLDLIVRVLHNVYWICILIITFFLYMHWDEAEPLGSILPWVSTNGIPSYLIVIQIAYSIAYFFKNNSLPLLSALITMMIALFGLGRGSIIIGFGILIVTLVFNLLILKSNINQSILRRVSLFFGLPLFLIISYNTHEIIELVVNIIGNSKFSEGITEQGRFQILVEYVSKLNGMGVIFGESYENTSINQKFGGNPHNSFIRAHSFFGIIGLILIFIPIFALLFSNRKLIEKVIVFALVFLALLRATVEPIFFPTPLDFFYFFYFLLFFRFSKVSR